MTDKADPVVRHLRWQRFRFHLVSWLMVVVFRLFWALWELIKWSFAPIAFLIDVLIILPLAKFMMRMAANPEFELIQEDDLPDYAWAGLEESKQRLIQTGYEVGQWVRVRNMGNNQILYLMSMVHPQLQLGLGIGYMEMTKDNRDDRPSDMAFAEATLQSSDGSLIDLTTMVDADILRQVPNRSRYNYSELGVPELSMLVSQVSKKTGFVSNEEALTELINDAPKLMRDEYAAAMGYAQQRGYLKPDGNSEKLKLTWAGAFRSTLMTLWPTSVYFKYKEEKAAEAFCASLGIEPTQLYDSASGRGEVSYDCPIYDLDELSQQLQKVLHRVSLLAEYRPASLHCGFDDDNRMAEISVYIERRKAYEQRDYIMATEASLCFHNHTLTCDYDCSSFDLLVTRKDYEAMDRPPLLPTLTELLPLSRILEIALATFNEQQVEISDAALDMGEENPVWSLSFIDKPTGTYVWVRLDAISGTILKEEDEATIGIPAL